MKFPSLFRTPTNKRFHFEPRYYDPVKEFVEERKAIAENGKENKNSDEYSPSRIRFERRKSSQGLNSSLLQLVIALVLSGMIVGWLYFGDDMLYAMLGLIPLYFYFKFRRK